MANYINRLTIALDGDTATIEGIERIGAASGRTATKIKEDNAEVEASNARAGESFTKVGEHASRLREALVFAAGAAGFGALTFGIKDLVGAGVKFQEENSQMVQALKSTGAYSREAAEGLSDYAEKAATKGGFSADQNLENLTKLITVTGSATKAQSQFNLATDLARRYHVNLASATKAVMQADAGRTTGLARLTGATSTNLTGEQALAIARQKTAGATAAYSKTVAGAMSNASNAIDNAGRAVSQALLPYIAKLAGWLASHLPNAIKATIAAVKDMIGWFKQHVAIVKAVAAGLAVFVGILGPLILAVKAYTIVQGLLNAVMEANPIVLVVTAIAALAAGFVYAYEKVGWFHNAVDAVFGFLKTAGPKAFHAVVGAAKDVWDWIKAHWVIAIFAAPFVMLPVFVATHFGQILTFFRGLPSKVTSIFKSVWNGMKSGFGDVVNWIIDRINNIIDAINGVDAVSIFGHRIGAGKIGHIQHIHVGASSGGTSGKPGVRASSYQGLNLPSTYPSVRPNASQATASEHSDVTSDSQRPIHNHINTTLNLDGKRISKSVQRNALIAHAQQGAFATAS